MKEARSETGLLRVSCKGRSVEDASIWMSCFSLLYFLLGKAEDRDSEFGAANCELNDFWILEFSILNFANAECGV